jgi:hypothetical protein
VRFAGFGTVPGALAALFCFGFAAVLDRAALAGLLATALADLARFSGKYLPKLPTPG